MTDKPIQQLDLDAVRKLSPAAVDRALHAGELDDLLAGRQPRPVDGRAEKARALRDHLATLPDEEIVRALRAGELDAALADVHRDDAA